MSNPDPIENAFRNVVNKLFETYWQNSLAGEDQEKEAFKRFQAGLAKAQTCREKAANELKY